MQGTVKFFLPAQNFGFIQITDGRMVLGEFYFRGGAVTGEPVRARDEVEFYLDYDYRGPCAVDVRRLHWDGFGWGAAGMEKTGDGGI